MKSLSAQGFRVSEAAGRRRPVASAPAARPPLAWCELPLIRRLLELSPADFEAEIQRLTSVRERARQSPALRRGLAAAAATLSSLYRQPG